MSAADTIGFFGFFPSMIQLTNVDHAGEIVINNSLTINGPGASLLTISGFAGSAALAGDGRANLQYHRRGPATFKDVSISGLTLTGGDTNDQGGAIRNASEN